MYCMHITVITSKENFRSAYFLSSENKRLPGHVFKQMYSSSFMLCNQACLKHSARCASTNFIKFNEETDEGHCELNEEEPRSSVYDDIKLTDQPGTTFTMFLKVRSLADKLEEFSSNLIFSPLHRSVKHDSDTIFWWSCMASSIKPLQLFEHLKTSLSAKNESSFFLINKCAGAVSKVSVRFYCSALAIKVKAWS